MNMLPNEERVGVLGSTLITDTLEKGRELAMLINKHTIHQIQPNLDMLEEGKKVIRKT